MKQTLQIRLSQQLALTPQLQQSIKLLQMSNLEMMQEIAALMADNPLLEYSDEFSEISTQKSEQANENTVSAESTESDSPADLDLDDARWENDIGNVKTKTRNDSDDDDDDWFSHRTQEETLTQHLEKQVQLLNLSPRDRGLCVLVIENLDEDGYLRTPIAELLQSLPHEMEFSEEELNIALCLVQGLDPAGVAARDLQECLCLQLLNNADLHNESEDDANARALALKIVEQYLNKLAARDFSNLKKELKVDDAQLKAAHQLILRLNPKPGAQFGESGNLYILPDVVVRKVRGKWKAYINPDAYPRLRVNRLYADALKSQREGHDMGGKLQEAKWLVKNIEQRFDTILRVSQAIIERQRSFFEYGETAMRPLILREIAQAVDLHESTISRVTSQKYMATPRGLFELKYFFGSHITTDSGGEYSATATKAMIRQFIAAEDKRKPLSDAKISEMLGKDGIMIARRTVAKYREALGIATASMRKTLWIVKIHGQLNFF